MYIRVIHYGGKVGDVENVVETWYRQKHPHGGVEERGLESHWVVRGNVGSWQSGRDPRVPSGVFKQSASETLMGCQREGRVRRT